MMLEERGVVRKVSRWEAAAQSISLATAGSWRSALSSEAKTRAPWTSA